MIGLYTQDSCCDYVEERKRQSAYHSEGYDVDCVEESMNEIVSEKQMIVALSHEHRKSHPIK